MKDFYAILGVNPQATQKEIKSAFRKKAKQGHPDMGGRDAEAMRVWLEAYRVLSSAVLRHEYDRKRRSEAASEFDYREWLKERHTQPEYAAKLIIYDLLHGFEDEALSIYDMLRLRDEGRLERFFERAEAMDAEFCIAEELRAKGRFVDAYGVMEKLIRMEQEKPAFGYFYEVVLFQFRHVVLDDLPNVLDAESMLEILSRAVELHSSEANDANFLRRQAELLCHLDRADEAAAAASGAFDVLPELPGLEALSKKIMRRQAARCALEV